MTTTSVPYSEAPVDSVKPGDILQALRGDVKWGAVTDVTLVPADPEGREVDPIAPFVPAIRVTTEHADAPTQNRYWVPGATVRVVR